MAREKKWVKSTFYISLSDDESLQVNPVNKFNAITEAKLVSLLTAEVVDIVANRESDEGEVNFRVRISDKGKAHNVAHLNGFENDLTDESSDEERTEVIDALKEELKGITVDDVSKPLSSTDADRLLDLM